MSFISILKKIGGVALAVDQMGAPYVSLFNPAAGAVMNAVAGLVVKAETTYTGEKQGTAKKQIVLDEFEALFPMFQTVLKEQAGLILTFDATQVSSLIDATVAQMNAAKALHDTFKIAKVAA